MVTCHYTQKCDGSAGDKFCSVFCKEFIQLKGEDSSILEDTEWTLDLESWTKLRNWTI